jgi:hypothetical protein
MPAFLGWLVIVITIGVRDPDRGNMTRERGSVPHARYLGFSPLRLSIPSQWRPA